MKSVLVFRAKDDFEAQYARDILKENDIHVFHVPGSGFWGRLDTKLIAVAEDDADRAVALLKEQQLNAEKESGPSW